jgi:iron(III) transport system substrate-binding protein
MISEFSLLTEERRTKDMQPLRMSVVWGVSLPLPLVLCPMPVWAKTTLVVSTALAADQLKAGEQAFAQANPAIAIRRVRDSTGMITAKLLAEKAPPVANGVMGLTATSLMLLEKEEMLVPYAPQGLEK